MKTDDLNEWQIRYEQEDIQQMLSTSVERRGSQIIFQFPQHRPSIDTQLARTLSPSKSNRDTTPTQRWSLLSRQQLFSRQIKAAQDSIRNLQICDNCHQNGTRTSRIKSRSLKSSPNNSPTHINQLILKLQDPSVSVQSRSLQTSSTRIRIRKPVFNYQSLKIKLEEPQETKLNHCNSMPTRTTLHSKKYSQLYHQAVKKELERRQALKKIPRKRRKKIIAHVSPEAPKFQEMEKIQCKPEALKKDRKMLNFRIDQRKSLSHQPQLINSNTLMQILRLKKEIKLGILTNS